MIKVGITGGIGAGKSTVCRILETLSVPVYSADEESKKILFSDQHVKQKLLNIFGEEILTSGKPDTKKISAIVFKSPERLSQLNSILHPATYHHFLEWCSSKQNIPYVILEAALIYETGGDQYLDKIIVITASADKRIKRTMERNNMTETEVKSRMQYQLPEEQLKERADFTITNEEDTLLLPQVLSVHDELISLSKTRAKEHFVRRS